MDKRLLDKFIPKWLCYEWMAMVDDYNGDDDDEKNKHINKNNNNNNRIVGCDNSGGTDNVVHFVIVIPIIAIVVKVCKLLLSK